MKKNQILSHPMVNFFEKLKKVKNSDNNTLLIEIWTLHYNEQTIFLK